VKVPLEKSFGFPDFQLLFAVLISILGSYLGLDLALTKEFTGGPSIVSVLGGIFILASVYKIISRVFNKAKA